MDFLLIVVAILGFVVAVVMLLLAARARRESMASQERAETLEALATGSVLFAHAADAADEPAVDEWGVDDAQFDAAIAEPPAPEVPRFTVLEPAPVPPASRLSADKLDVALSEFADEAEPGWSEAVNEQPPAPTAVAAPVPSTVFPFVMTVPVAAGVGRVQISFDRSRSRSGS